MGEDTAPEVHIPVLFALLLGTAADWGYSTVRQTQTGTQISMPRGKVLGGSSSMNAMIYIRGNRADYDGWRDKFGAKDWGFDDVLPYFLRAERNSRLSGPLHGTDGPLHVQDVAYSHELNQLWVDSAVAWGLPRNDDFNGPTQFGTGSFQLTYRDGRRWSAADASCSRPAEPHGTYPCPGLRSAAGRLPGRGGDLLGRHRQRVRPRRLRGAVARSAHRARHLDYSGEH